MKEGEGLILDQDEHDEIHLYHDLHQIDIEYVRLHKKRTEIMNKIGAIYDRRVLNGKPDKR